MSSDTDALVASGPTDEAHISITIEADPNALLCDPPESTTLLEAANHHPQPFQPVTRKPLRSQSEGGGGEGVLRPSAPTPLMKFESNPETSAEKQAARVEHPVSEVKSLSWKQYTKRMSRFVKRAISLQDASLTQTFYCGICLENCDTALTFPIRTCEKHHNYCKPCMTSYTRIQAESGAISYPCPGLGECSAALAEEELRVLLSEELWSRHLRLTQVKTNPLYRECPKCNHGMTATSSEASSANPQLRCEGCQYEYCFLHSDAHPNRSCQEYARAMSSRARHDLQQTDRLLKRVTKPCPKCHIATEKNGGCNHMLVVVGVCKSA